jgi:hypothetical protein
VALKHKGDTFWQTATTLHRALLTAGARYVTSNFVLDEAYTLLLHRAGHHIAVELGEEIRFLSPFGDITLWNILISCVVLPYISLYSRMTNQMLWGHILSVAPETASMEGEARFHLDTSHNRPDAFVT